jgi:hypothetical protein
MDIRKPKPWHGFREFLKEYVIIVVGVLTALAAEQAVEWLHWQAQVRATEQSLLAEVQINLLDMSERVLVRPCQAQRAVDLRDALLRSDGHWHANTYLRFLGRGPLVAKPHASLADVAANSTTLAGQPMPVVYGGPRRPWSDTVFQSALVTGVFNHMPSERAAAYARIDRAIITMRNWQAAEEAAETHLSALAFDGVVGPVERAAYLNELGELDLSAAAMSGSAAQTLIAADRAGLRVKRTDFEKRFSATTVYAACRADLLIPLAQN